MNADALRQHYEALWPRLLQAVPHDQGVSMPLFISVPDSYWTARVRLMIVGKETKGWGGLLGVELGADPVGKIQEGYRTFEFGKKYRGSPFLHEARRLAKLCEPDVPANGFVWSNLYLCDQGARRPRPDVARKLLDLRSLPQEIQILRPCAIVFFTGWHYDDALFDLFPSAGKSSCEGLDGRLLSRIAHPDLPTRTFRTYHPNYLWRSRQRAIVDTIARLIRQP